MHTTVAHAPAYGQCGGQQYTGSTVCINGYACYVQSPYYSQCLTPAPAYGQCGGISFGGATTCVDGYSCIYQNQYYSQCLLTLAPSYSPSSSPTNAPSVTPTFCFYSGALYCRVLYEAYQYLLPLVIADYNRRQFVNL